MSMHDELTNASEIRDLLTDDTAYKVYVINMFKEITLKMEYQQVLLEHQIVESKGLEDRLTSLLSEHNVCRAGVNEILKYRDQFEWMKKFHNFCSSVMLKLFILFLSGLLVWLLIMFGIHMKEVGPRPPEVQEKFEIGK